MQASSQGPVAAGASLGLVTSLSLLSEQEPQGAQLLSAERWRSCRLGKLCKARTLLPKEASQGHRPGDSLSRHSSKPSWFQNCAWALPGFMCTDGAFILAVFFFFPLGPKTRLGAKHEQQRKKDQSKQEGKRIGKKREKRKNHRLPKLVQGGPKEAPELCHFPPTSVICHPGNCLVPSPSQAPFLGHP